LTALLFHWRRRSHGFHIDSHFKINFDTIDDFEGSQRLVFPAIHILFSGRPANGQRMISGSWDKTARRWDQDLKAGKEIEEARDICESKYGQWRCQGMDNWLSLLVEIM
jgi:hypothetical protein